MNYMMIQVKTIGIPEYHFCDNLGNVVYKMKRKAISFGDKYTIYDNNDIKIGELNSRPFRHGLYELIHNDENIDYILRKFTFLNPSYYLEKNGWCFSPSLTSAKYQVFDGEKLVMVIERQLTLKNEKYNVKVFDGNKLYLCALVALSTILLTSYRNRSE